MANQQHLFLSKKGALLPRWREAFPDARGAIVGSPVSFGAGLLWLHLQQGASVAEQVKAARAQAGNAAALVVMSDLPEDEQALLALAAGARGYCNSHATTEVLLQVASVISQGGLWIGETLMQRLIARSAETVTAPSNIKQPEQVLTHREIEVAREVGSGASNKEIAARLHISERTVKVHISAIFEKLDVRDRLQLAMLMRDRA